MSDTAEAKYKYDKNSPKLKQGATGTSTGRRTPRSPRSAPAAAQSAPKTAAPGTGTGAPRMDQRLLTNTWPKQCTEISIQANTNKN